MAGIADMSNGAGYAPPERIAMQEGGVQEGEPNVTPEEQAQFDEFMGNARKIIYPKDDKGFRVSDNVLQGLAATKDKPMLALATTAVSIVVGLRDSAERAGQMVDQDVMFHAGADIVAELAEVAEVADIAEFSEEDVEKAFYLALDMYSAQAQETGHLDKEGMQQGWNQIVTADQQGQLAEVMPGIGERMKEAG